MRSTLPVLALAAVCLFAQNAQESPSAGGQALELIPITADTVVATINGQKFTAGDLERITQNLNSVMREMAGTQPQAFLEQYALALTLKTEAQKMKLHEAPPYRERIEEATRQILVNAVLSEKAKQEKISDEDLSRIYERKKTDYRQAVAKVIFVSRMGYRQALADGKTTTVSPAEAKAKAEKVAKLAREGKDFLELAKEHSDDRDTAEAGADFPYPIRANATNVPQEIRTALLAAKADEIVGPVEHDTGFYIFRVASVEQGTFEEVKEDIERELRQALVNRWLEEMKKKSSVTLDHDPFWNTFMAANKEALERQRSQQAENAAGGAK